MRRIVIIFLYNLAISFSGVPVNISFIKEKPLIIELNKFNENEYKGIYGEYEVIVVDKNKNSKPDINGDEWIFYKNNKPFFAWKFSGNKFFIFKLDGKDPKLYTLEEYFPEFKIDIPDFLPSPYSKESKNNILYPFLIIEDWANKGKFLEGNLIEGGYLSNGRVIIGNKFYCAYDLDDDGDIDIIRTNLHILLDFKDEMKDELKISLKYPNFNVTYTRNYDIGKNKSFFSKTFLPGRIYKGAMMGFEEHIFIKEEPSELFKNGAQFFIKTTNENIDRMTFGGLSNEGNLNWNIEIDPLETEPYQPPTLRICEYKDKWGNLIKFTSSVFPTSWDGKKVEFIKIKGTNIYEFFPDAPWYKVTTGEYFKLKGVNICFSNQGDYMHCDEGMYVGSLTWKERIEGSRKNSFILYYSPLFSGLHLKWADYGYSSYPLGYNRGPSPFDYTTVYHLEGLELPPKYTGIRAIHKVEGKRFEGPIFLHYKDMDKDGYIDTYLYDADNDGIFEKSLFYIKNTNTLIITDEKFTSLIPYNVKFEEVEYQMQNYDRIKELFRKGYPEIPLIKRINILSSGKPVEMKPFYFPEGITFAETFPSFFISIDNNWKNKFVILKTINENKFTWTDFSINGFVRLATLLNENNLITEEIKEISKEKIEDKDIILIPNLEKFLSKDELNFLLNWVKDGGILILNCPEDEEKTFFFNYLGKSIGYKLIPQLINKRTVLYKEAILGQFGDPKAPLGEERAPGPWNRIENFKGEKELIENLKYISFVGFEIKIDKYWKPLLIWQDKILIAQKNFGKGKIIICGINCFSNKYLIHPQFFEPIDNDKFLENFIFYLKNQLSLPYQINLKTLFNKFPIEIRITGKGGTIIIPYGNYNILVNNQNKETIRKGTTFTFDLPKGEYQIKIEKKE